VYSISVSITLVIPAYNRASLIAETLDSALNQTEPFLEIIVVDDGSTDGTAAVLDRYGDRIRRLHVANGGVQRARNLGVAAATGQYVALCDSDDLLEPGYVETMRSWLVAHPQCDSIYSNFVTFDEEGIIANKFADAPSNFFDGAQRSGAFYHAIPDLYARTLQYQPLFSSGNLIRRSLYEQLGGYDAQFNGVGGEDYEFTLRLVAVADMALCNTPLVRVRRHRGNDSTDNVRQVSGDVVILEYALAHHPAAAKYRDAILESIAERLLDIFNGAFARGSFDIASATLGRMRQRPGGLAFRLKVLITHLPSPLRKTLWQMTQ
jgi:hypothetical protein